MTARGPRGSGWTRRAVLCSSATFLLQGRSEKRQDVSEERPTFPSEKVRFADGATEFTVERLTAPSHSSYLPPCWQRAFSRRGGFLLFWSNRTGRPQAFRMDERTGESRQLTDAQALDGSSIALSSDDRNLCCFDGPVLLRLALSNFRERAVYRVPNGWLRGPGFSLSRDNDHGALAESRNGASRLRLVRIGGGAATTVLEAADPLSDPILSPRADAILYRRGTNSLWVIGRRGRPNERLMLPPGRIGPAFWSPDGRTVLYLHHPDEPGKLSAIREYNTETRTDQLVSATSQFASFGPNANASVFVGASASKASPYVLLLLRATRRELTLCEHRATDAARVAPVFSPDSRRIYFQSDRLGNSVLYRMAVEKLVEPTET